LLESRRDRAVNEELKNLYELLVVSVEYEFKIAGQVVVNLQVELSLDRILKLTSTPGGNLIFSRTPDEYSISMADRHQTYSVAIPSIFWFRSCMEVPCQRLKKRM
jgi:hypothetical protein